MEFEFQESDIVFSDDHQEHQDRFSPDRTIIQHDEVDENLYLFNFQDDLLVPIHAQSNNSRVRRHKSKRSKKITNSPPVDIPEKFLRSPDCSDDSFEDDGYDSGEMIPPHVIVGRRVAGKIASSICTSNGRMMKGRYMNELRNSILRMTGFLES